MLTNKLKLLILIIAVLAVTRARAADGDLAESQATTIPEPPTILVGALLVLPLGASAIRILRKNESKQPSRL